MVYCLFFVLMRRRPPRSTRTDTLFPYTTLFRSVLEGKIKILWIAATNPAQSMPDQAKVRAALQKAELVIVQEAFANTETLAYRSEEHTSELQSLMRISYAVFCLKKKKTKKQTTTQRR